MPAGYRLFWQQFRRDFHATGSVVPSGRALARALTRYVRDTPGPRRILEVGPGTGAVTTAILRAMGPDDRLELVELNATFAEHLRERFASDPVFRQRAAQAVIRNQSIESLADELHDAARASTFSASLPPSILDPRSAGNDTLTANSPAAGYDLIVSGLPFNNFPVETVDGILQQYRRLLKPGGTLSFFEYVAVRPLRGLVSSGAERRRLRGVGKAIAQARAGRQVRRDLVLRNVPPAWVHHLRNPRAG